jgi:hypothetical protein
MGSGDPAQELPGWQSSYERGRADMVIELAMMSRAERERVLARALAGVVPLPLAPWDNPEASVPVTAAEVLANNRRRDQGGGPLPPPPEGGERITVRVPVSIHDDPDEVAARVEAALGEADPSGVLPVTMRVELGGDPGAAEQS